MDPSFLLPKNTDSIAGVDSGTPPSYSGYLTVPNTNRECQTESRKGFLGWTGYHIFHICLLCIAIYTTVEFIFLFDMIQLCDRMFDPFWISDFCFCFRVSEVGGRNVWLKVYRSCLLKIFFRPKRNGPGKKPIEYIRCQNAFVITEDITSTP